ncbi:MAG: RES family NAD+ phosphorylase [Chitinophagaceae bacterium]|nr:RES family NAD+ phosphorylase [Chitinophagaceae bacterium]
MIVYRLANSEYKDDLSGYGSFLYGGRWNSRGLYALYATEHISLAVLEIVVNYNRSAYSIRTSYHLLEIFIPDVPLLQINVAILKKKWQEDFEYSQMMGDQFLQQKNHLLLKIPSAVIPEENNFLINPDHPDYKKIKIKTSRPYGLDTRLF